MPELLPQRGRTRGWTWGLLDAVLPQTCVACGQWIPACTGVACESCSDQLLAALALSYCPRCGRTLPQTAIHEDACARCKTEHFWNVAGVARAGLYNPAMRALTTGLKYRGQERNADYLADLLAAAMRACGWADSLDALVPVPMHWLRRLQRPCDHARLLTEALARRLRLPVLRIVRRAKRAPSQTGMTSKAARFENVRGAFELRRWGRRDIRGQTVCIVDNLIATGATVTEVSKVLRKAGAKKIFAAAVIRSASPGDPRTAAWPAGPGPDVEDVR